MDLTAWTIGVFFVSFLLWAFTGSFLAVTLRQDWPHLYELAGSPTAGDFWWRRAFPNAFDSFLLWGRFRAAGIPDSTLLLWFEAVRWLRWLQVLSFAAFVLSLFVPGPARHAP